MLSRSLQIADLRQSRPRNLSKNSNSEFSSRNADSFLAALDGNGNTSDENGRDNTNLVNCCGASREAHSERGFVKKRTTIEDIL